MQNRYLLCFLFLSLLMSGCADEKDIPPPVVYLNMPDNGYEKDLEDTLAIVPKITYDYHTTYKWILNNEVVSTDKDILVYPSDYGKFEYLFVVNSPSGADSAKITVQAMKIVDFEEFVMEKDTFGIGVTSDFGFHSKELFLQNYYFGFENWAGFAYSNRIDKSTLKIANQFSAYPAKGAGSSKNYGVYKQDPEGPLKRIVFTDGLNHALKSISVTNSSLVYLTIKSGFGDAKKFDQGDWLRLTIRGYDANGGKTGQYTYLLSNYNFVDFSDRYAVDSWRVLNLSDSLGVVNQLEFLLESSDSENGVMVTPAYFCLDDLKIVN